MKNDLLSQRSKNESEVGSSPALFQPSGWAHPAVRFQERATGQEDRRRSGPTSARMGCQTWLRATPKRCIVEISSRISTSRCQCCARLQIPAPIENLETSRLWKLRSFQVAGVTPRSTWTTTDFCQDGTPRRERTAVLATQLHYVFILRGPGPTFCLKHYTNSLNIIISKIYQKYDFRKILLG